MYTDDCITSEKRFLSHAYRDGNGAIRWKSNHWIPPRHIMQAMERLAVFHPGVLQDETPNLQGQRRRLGL